MSIDHELYNAVNHVYAIYARAADEKRFDLLDEVFTPQAVLEYIVGPHEFSCSGAEAAENFKAFLELCYWTGHLIGAPMVERRGPAVHATARVTATHLQRRDDGTMNRWLVRGSYHDQLGLHDGRWLIERRLCVCPDEEGSFMDAGVARFADLAWTSRELIA